MRKQKHGAFLSTNHPPHFYSTNPQTGIDLSHCLSFFYHFHTQTADIPRDHMMEFVQRDWLLHSRLMELHLHRFIVVEMNFIVSMNITDQSRFDTCQRLFRLSNIFITFTPKKFETLYLVLDFFQNRIYLYQWIKIGNDNVIFFFFFLNVKAAREKKQPINFSRVYRLLQQREENVRHLGSHIFALFDI